MENQGQVWERSTTLKLILKTPHILLRMVEFTVRWRTTWDYKEFHGILVCGSLWFSFVFAFTCIERGRSNRKASVLHT